MCVIVDKKEKGIKKETENEKIKNKKEIKKFTRGSSTENKLNLNGVKSQIKRFLTLIAENDKIATVQ